MAQRASNDSLTQFGEYLATVRQYSNISAEEMAAKMGISRSSLSRLERGNREPRLGVLMLAAAVIPRMADDFKKFLKTGTFPNPYAKSSRQRR